MIFIMLFRGTSLGVSHSGLVSISSMFVFGLAIFGVIICLILYLNSKHGSIKFPVMIPLFMLLILLIYLFPIVYNSLANNLYEPQMFEFIKLFFSVLLFMLFFLSFRNESEIIGLCKFVVILGGFLGLFYFVNYLLFGYISRLLFGQLIYGDPNFLGRNFGICCLLSLFLYIKEKRNAWLFISLISFSGLLLSASRGALISFLVTLLFVIMINLKSLTLSFKNLKIKRSYINIFIGIIGIVVFGMFYAISNYQRNIGLLNRLLLGSSDALTSFFSRWDIYRDTLTLISGKWSGYGIGQFGFYYQDRFGSAVPYPHNIFLDLMFDNGLLGALIFISLIFIVLVNLFRKSRNNSSVLLVFTTLCFIIMTLNFSHKISNVFTFWIFCAFGLRLIYLKKAKNEA